MLIIKKNKSRIFIASILVLLIVFNIVFQYPWLRNQLTSLENDEGLFSDENNLQTSETDYYSTEWIKYGNFSTGASSYWESETSGDISDFNLAISGEAATYNVMGEQREFSLDEDPVVGSNWSPVPNPEIPGLMNDNYSDSEGLHANYTFLDQYSANQNPSIHWDNNCSMPVNMDDYEITSASLQSVVNATVDKDVDVSGDTIANDDNGAPLNRYDSYDIARFYVLLSDLSKNKVYEIGYYQNSSLGAGDPPGTYYMSDKNLISVSEDVLIFYLTSVLGSDNYNFTVTLGIRIYAADNSNTYDIDDFTDLLFKSINLTFTYEKKINQLDTASWKQEGKQESDKIPSNYLIENATLNFRYKTDLDWISNTGSVNSEFRIIINNNQLGETVKLSSATTSYQDFKTGGLDVSNFVDADEYVNISIQIYIADEFILNSDITISIDNVTLNIWYGIYTEPDDTDYNLILDDVDRTIEKSAQVTFNENLNVTFVYKDSLDDFIPDADVELTGGAIGLIPLLPNGFENYYAIINSSDLGVGTTILTLTASKRYYTTQQIQINIEVVNRDTEIQLFLDNDNQTIDKEWTTDWDEDLNITIRYRDINDSPSTHIKNATVELTGVGPTRVLDEDEANEQYEIIIDTFDLGSAPNSFYLTVYASKDNYTALNIKFKINLEPRTTYLDNIELDGSETDRISIEWNENFEIRVAYNDTETGIAITGATLQLIGTDYQEDLEPSGNLYNLSVNTFDLSIGPNILTIFAQKDNYSVASEFITVNVEERATTIETILNNTSTEVISYPFGELLNITAIYEDNKTSSFIDGAEVELRGATATYNLNKTGGLNQYSVIVNTTLLDIGVNLLTIYAKQDNYSAAFKSITIIVDERDTNLAIYLDGSFTTAVDKEYDELLNITVVYNDLDTGTFIDGATCQLRRGEELLYNIPRDPSYLQYERVINTKYLDLGTNSLAIYANQDNYSAFLVSITIIVKEKTTALDVILDDNPGTMVEVIYGEILNVTAIYKDNKTSSFIDGAIVQLRDGITVLESFNESTSHYDVLINSNRLSLGGNILSIYAEKANYSTLLVSILVIVNERTTYLDVLLDGINCDTFEFYNVSINDSVDITAIYNDFEDIFVPGATLELTVSGFSDTFVPGAGQYTYTLDALTLGVGVHFLVISANLENYSASIKNIKLNVLERSSYLDLFIDDANLTEKRYVATEIDKFLNVTLFFTDPADSSYISNADIRLTGALEANFTEIIPLQQYNVSIDTNTLQQGINFLTIFAQKENYESRSLIFTVEVKQKNSSLQVILNNVTDPIDNSIKVTISDFVNVTVIYEDDEMNFIDNASLIIVGEGLNQVNLSKHPVYDQYNVSINTLDLNFGINLLTLYAQKANYQPQTLIIRIEINEKETDMDIYLNGIPQTTQDRSITLPIKELLNITVKYYDNETEQHKHIPGSVIQLVGEDLTDYYLNESASLEQYTISINTTLLDIGVRFLTVYATHANFQSYSALLRIQVNRIKTNIITTSGKIVFNRQPGDNFRLQLQLQDLNFSVNVLKANVSYTWVYGQGKLSDANNDGIYETTITNLPEGTFQIAITAYAGDDYDFERFFVTLNVIRPPEDVLLFQILTITGIAAAVGISAYLIAYQRVLKYPKQVRKIRKFKSKLKKSKPSGIETLSRDEIIEKTYAEKIHPLEKQLKGKMTRSPTENSIQKEESNLSEKLGSK